MSNEFTRNIQDAAKIVSVALPAAGANVSTPTIDLEQVVGGLLENVCFELSIPATPSLVDAKVITCKVFDGAASNSLAVIDPLISTTITGVATSQGGPAKSIRFRLPPTARRYIAVNVAVESGGGSNIAVDTTLKLLF